METISDAIKGGNGSCQESQSYNGTWSSSILRKKTDRQSEGKQYSSTGSVMAISHRFLGLVVGKEGVTKKRIETQCQVELHVEAERDEHGKQRIQINGPTENMDKA